MAKILILISSHLSMVPRPLKEAEVLSNNGHKVVIFGNWFDSELARQDQILMSNKKWDFRPVVDFCKGNCVSNIHVRFQRFKSRLIYRQIGIVLPELLGYCAKAMLKAAWKFKADLTIVHSEVGLWAGRELIKAGFNVGVDFEDWFSENLLPEDRKSAPVNYLKALEKYMIQNCSYRLTTSHALAEALAKTYDTSKPEVVYNVFPLKEKSNIDGKCLDKKNSNIRSLHWFSQTIGPGRGLETLFEALQHLSTFAVEIHLRGNCYKRHKQWLEALIPISWKDKTFIHEVVPNDQLLSRITEHDIGLALESADVISRDLTVTNKYFQYLLAGLAIIATDTTGQREIFSQYPKVGWLIPCNDSLALSEAINDLIMNPDKLNAAKSAALRAAKDKFNWELQNMVILQETERALK